MLSVRAILALAPALAPAFAACGGESVPKDEIPDWAQPESAAGAPAAADEEPGARVLLFLRVDSQSVRTDSVAVAAGGPAGRVMDPDEFRITLRDRRGNAVGRIATWDPLAHSVWDSVSASERGDRRPPDTPILEEDDRRRPGGLAAEEDDRRRPRRPIYREHVERMDSVEVMLPIPLRPGLAVVEFSRPDGPSLGSAKLEAVIRGYCEPRRAQTVCREWLAVR